MGRRGVITCSIDFYLPSLRVGGWGGGDRHPVAQCILVSYLPDRHGVEGAPGEHLHPVHDDGRSPT